MPSSESSLSPLSTPNMSRFGQQQPIDLNPDDRAQIQAEMNTACVKLMEKYQLVLDMMEDFTVEDVHPGNTDRVDAKLEKISDARSDFRTAVRQYKELYGEYGDSGGNLDSYLLITLLEIILRRFGLKFRSFVHL